MDDQDSDSDHKKYSKKMTPLFRSKYYQKILEILGKEDMTGYMHNIQKFKKNGAKRKEVRERKQLPNVKAILEFLKPHASARVLHDKYAESEKVEGKSVPLSTCAEMTMLINRLDQQDSHSADDEMQDVDNLTSVEVDNEGVGDPETGGIASAPTNQPNVASLPEVEISSEEDSRSSKTCQLPRSGGKIDVRFSMKYTTKQYGYQRTLRERFSAHDFHLIGDSLNEDRDNGQLTRIGGIVATVKFEDFVITDEETLKACDNKSLKDKKLKVQLIPPDNFKALD